MILAVPWVFLPYSQLGLLCCHVNAGTCGKAIAAVTHGRLEICVE